MKHTSGRKFNKIMRRVLSLTLCCTMAFTTVVTMGTSKADAETGQKKIGYQWERIYDNAQAKDWISTIQNSKVRILIIYGKKDEFYVGREDSYKGSYYGKLVSNQIRTDLDTFITRKDFNTPIVEYGGHDGDNGCEKFKIHMTDAYGNPTNYWLYHENIIFPCIFKGLFTFKKSLNDEKDDDEVAFTMRSDRWDAASFQFHISNDYLKRSHFIQRNLDKYFNGKPMSELSEANQKKVMEYAARDIATLAAMYSAGANAKIEDIYEKLKEYEGKGTYSDDLFCPQTKVDLDAEQSVRETQAAQQKEEFYHLEREWSGITRYNVNGQDVTYQQAIAGAQVPGMNIGNIIFASVVGTAAFGVLGLIGGGIVALVEYIKAGKYDYLLNTAKIYYNIKGRIDTAWRQDGSEIYDSWSERGEAASFKVYFGREVELPTLTNDYTVTVNETQTIEGIDIAPCVVVTVGKGSTLIIRGQVVNEGNLEVYGNVIIEKGSVLTDELDPGTGAQRKYTKGGSGTEYMNGKTTLYAGSCMIVQEGAAHLQYKSPFFDIKDGATYICDGVFISTAEIEVHGTMEIGPTGEAAIGAYADVEKGELEGVKTYLQNHSVFDLVLGYKDPTIIYGSCIYVYERGELRVFGLMGLYRPNADHPVMTRVSNGGKIIGYEGVLKDFTPGFSGFEYYEKYQQWE